MKKIGIIGVSGFGKAHLNFISQIQDKCKLVAAAVRNTDRVEKDVELAKHLGAKIYVSAYEMFDAEKDNIDIVSIPTSIDSHCEYSVAALKRGYDVICEKPVAGSIEEAMEMKEAAERSGKILTIGFQNIFSPTIQKIKELRVSKRFGELIMCKSYALWPRSSAYYKRNLWAGKLFFNGKKIYDSPIQNATAHYLHNLFYIAGESQEESAMPQEIYAENYRAKEIESADTQFVRATTANKVKIHYAVTHSCKKIFGPVAEFIFESGKIIWDVYGKNDGHAKVYEKVGKEYKLIDEFDNGEHPIHTLVFLNTIEAIDNHTQPLSNINNAYEHTVCVNKCFGFGIKDVDKKYTEALPVEKEAYDPELDVSKEKNIVIHGIENLMEKMYKEEMSFKETGAEWAKD